jgi:hypothetical protein
MTQQGLAPAAGEGGGEPPHDANRSGHHHLRNACQETVSSRPLPAPASGSQRPAEHIVLVYW